MLNPAPYKGGWRLAILLLLAGATSASAAPQAGARPYSDRVDGLASVAGFTIRETHTGASESVEIFIQPRRDLRLPDGSPWIDFVARRQATDAVGGEAVTWATSKDCPALRNILIWLTTLVAPRIEIPGITPTEMAPDGRRPRTVTEDGLQTLVWGRGTQPDHIANTRVEISSNGGLIASFGRAEKHDLEACWRSDRPA